LHAIAPLHITRLSHAHAVTPSHAVGYRRLSSAIVGYRRRIVALPIAHKTKKRRRRCYLPSALVVVLSSCYRLFAVSFSGVQRINTDQDIQETFAD
jgi:hypothetical protein